MSLKPRNKNVFEDGVMIYFKTSLKMNTLKCHWARHCTPNSSSRVARAPWNPSVLIFAGTDPSFIHLHFCIELQSSSSSSIFICRIKSSFSYKQQNVHWLQGPALILFQHSPRLLRFHYQRNPYMPVGKLVFMQHAWMRGIKKKKKSLHGLKKNKNTIGK